MGADKPAKGGFAARMALFYGALFVVYGTHVPFTPMWLSWRGLSASEIATIMATPFFLRVIVTPAMALAADRRGSHRELMIVLAWLSLLFVLALSQASAFWPVLLLAVPLIICNSTLMPLAETMAVKGMREQGIDYGRVRLWGSLTFIGASFLGGMLIDRAGAGAGIWLVATGVAVTILATHFLPRIKNEPVPGAQSQSPFWHAEEPRRLLGSTPFVLFLLAIGCTQAAHAALLTYATLIWQSQGMNAGLCGILWAIAVLAEVVLFAYSRPIVQRVGPVALLVSGASFSILRWGAMAFDPPLALLVPLQMLHAATYAASHVAAIHFIHQAVPEHMQGSAQALYATIASGLAMGAATLIAGRVYAAAGSSAYLAMVAVAVAGFIAALALQRSWQGGVLNLSDRRGGH